MFTTRRPAIRVSRSRAWLSCSSPLASGSSVRSAFERGSRPVVGFLRDGRPVIAEPFEEGEGKLRTLQFLQQRHIDVGLLQPARHVLRTGTNGIHIPACNLHSRSLSDSAISG